MSSLALIVSTHDSEMHVCIVLPCINQGQELVTETQREESVRWMHQLLTLVLWIVGWMSGAQQIGYTFLPCVLAGLSRAPQLVRKRDRGGAGTLWADDVDCVVVPSDACGGNGTLALCHKTGRKVTSITSSWHLAVYRFTQKILQSFYMSIG
jgi:hypothetical protein